MKLYDYKNQLSRFFNEFNKVNIPFAAIKEKLSAAGIVVKDSEEKGDLFDTIQRNSEQLKEAITKLNAMLEEDEKNKTNNAEAFFTDTFRPLLENAFKEQTTFNTFVTAKNKNTLKMTEISVVYNMFNAANLGMGTCKKIDDDKQKSSRNMRLDGYQGPLENLFTMVDNINISFADLKAQLPAGRIVEKEGEEKGNFFDTMADNLEQLKTAVANLRDLMKQDELNNTKKAADFFFDTFQILLEDIKDKQENFQAFLAEKDFDELSIPGMKDVYNVFMAANSGLGLCHHINALNEMGKVENAKSEYEETHAAYKAAKKEFLERHKGQDVKQLLEESERLIKEAMQKKADYEIAHNEALNEEEKANKEIPELESGISTADQNISDMESLINSNNDKIKIIDSYRGKLDEAEAQYLKLNEELEGNLADKRTALGKLETLYGEKANDYSNSSFKLNNALIENSEITDDIESRMKMAECNILIQFIAGEYADVQDTTTYNDLNPEVKAILNKHVENVDKNPTVAQIYQELTTSMSVLAASLKSELDAGIVSDIQANAASALEVFKTEKVLNEMKKEVEEAELNVKNNKDAYDNAINEQYKAFSSEGAFKENTNTKPENFKIYLDNTKVRYEDLSKQAAKSKDASINKKNELNKQLTELKDKIKALKEKDEQLGKEQSQKYDEYDKKKDIGAEVKSLASLYHKSQRERKAAVEAYAAYKQSIEKGELASVKDAATKLFARVGDAAKGHKNSTEFQKLEDALKELKDAEPVNSADKIAKLQQIKNLAETYKQAKLDQHFHWIPSTLRTTRLKFADDVIEAAKERIERLEQFGDKELQELETLFGENSKNKAKVEKYLHNQEEKAFVQALSKKTVAQSEQKQEAAPKEEIKEEKENEMDDREL